MRTSLFLIIIAFVSITWIANDEENLQPCITFSFDDGNPNDILTYKGKEWNAMIVDQLKKYKIETVWFVGAKKLDNETGKQLLRAWDKAGHIIANHTYNHLNYNDTLMTYEDYILEIKKCDSLIRNYKNYQKIFRFPYLKAGNTIAKRDSLRAFLAQNGYRQGWVTIDASDWYVNNRLIKRLRENPGADISAFRDYYVNHMVERANYYNDLSLKINHRQIKHTILMHFNLTSALFLSDLIERFDKEGWKIVSYKEAIKDPIYKE